MTTIVVTAAIVERNGRFLITRRQRGVHLEGFWEFPGGKCEPGGPHPPRVSSCGCGADSTADRDVTKGSATTCAGMSSMANAVPTAVNSRRTYASAIGRPTAGERTALVTR